MNISMDQAEAWVAKVEREMADVNRVLDKAVACVEEYRDSDDTIYQELNNAAKKYESAWKHLQNAYRDVFDGLRSIFRSQAEAVNQALDSVKNVTKKAKM